MKLARSLRAPHVPPRVPVIEAGALPYTFHPGLEGGGKLESIQPMMRRLEWDGEVGVEGRRRLVGGLCLDGWLVKGGRSITLMDYFLGISEMRRICAP